MLSRTYKGVFSPPGGGAGVGWLENMGCFAQMPILCSKLAI